MSSILEILICFPLPYIYIPIFLFQAAVKKNDESVPAKLLAADLQALLKVMIEQAMATPICNIFCLQQSKAWGFI